MSRSLPRALAALPLLAALAGAAHAQTITAGSIPASPNFGFNPTPVAITAVDLTAPATGSGDMTTATFVWSLAPCAASVKIKFFRRSGDTLLFLAERGPFDVNATTQAVALSPGFRAGGRPDRHRACRGLWEPGWPEPGRHFGPRRVRLGHHFQRLDLFGNDRHQQHARRHGYGHRHGRASFQPRGDHPGRDFEPGTPRRELPHGRAAPQPESDDRDGQHRLSCPGCLGSASDPSMAYSINPGQTLFFPDVLTSLGQTGIGSLDLVATTGSAPVASVRVYNDAGAAGTSGFTEHGLKPSEALSAGARGILIGPFDPLLFRYNLGVRTLSTGATISITVRDAAGNILRTLARSYPANFFQQTDVASFLGGLSLAANQTVTVDVISGSLFVYGATADDRTNDPALDFAQSVPK